MSTRRPAPNLKRSNLRSEGAALGLWVLLLVLPGCAGLWSSLKSAAAPAAGGAAGAAVGSLGGPVGTIGGAAVGATVGHTINENASLRSGDLQGSGARKKEDERWKGLTPQEWADRASLAAQAQDWLSTIIKWSLAGLVVMFAFRNRHNFRELGLWRGLWHSVWGGRVARPN